MSDQKTTSAATHTGDDHPVVFNDYLRRCLYVFISVLCMVSLMLAASFAPIGGWPVKVTVILTFAIINAFVVAGFLMHLLTEKRMIYTLLAFTVFFFAGLMGLTLYAMQDFPTGTAVH